VKLEDNWRSVSIFDRKSNFVLPVFLRKIPVNSIAFIGLSAMSARNLPRTASGSKRQLAIGVVACGENFVRGELKSSYVPSELLRG
jgi:hypothetical protein